MEYHTVNTFTKMLATGAFALTAMSGAAQANDDESRAYEAELLADASNRISLLGEDDTTLDIGGTIQFRYMWNNADNGGTTDDTIGFDFGETSLNFSGEVDRFEYYLELDFMNYRSTNGQVQLDEAWIQTDFFSDGLNVRAGQFRTPFSREMQVEEEFQLFASRSFVDTIFGAQNTQGIMLTWEGNRARFFASFNDGARTQNTNFNSATEADFGVTGRAELLLAGESWDQFDDFTSERGDGFGLLAGAAVHYQQGGDTGALTVSGTTPDVEVFSYTGDISFENNGWNGFAAFHGRTMDMTAGSFDDYGLVAQTGFRIFENGEIFGGYEGVFADSNRGLADDNMNFAKAGYTHYIAGHAAKFTTDVFYSFDDSTGMNTLGSFGNQGLLGGTGEGEFGLRGQIQLVF